MKLINLCPHPIRIRHEDGFETVIPSSGNARVEAEYHETGTLELDGHPVKIIAGRYDGVVGLPLPVSDICYIVSHMTRMALPERSDLFSPADILRDAEGNIVACRMFEISKKT